MSEQLSFNVARPFFYTETKDGVIEISEDIARFQNEILPHITDFKVAVCFEIGGYGRNWYHAKPEVNWETGLLEENRFQFHLSCGTSWSDWARSHNGNCTITTETYNKAFELGLFTEIKYASDSTD